MIGIYKFTNKYNRKVYIGQSKNIELRYSAHKSAAKNSRRDTYFYRALRKYGFDSFDFEVVHQCPENQLDYWEKFYIKLYLSNEPKHGYNCTNGGQNGSKPNDIVRKKQSDWMKANSDKIHTPEANLRNSISHSGKKYSDETNAKKARRGEESAWWGKHHTEETKKKISEAHKGKSNLSWIGKHHTEETRAKMSVKHHLFLTSHPELNHHNLGRKRIHKDKQNKMVEAELLNEYLSNGWELGYYRQI